MRHWHIELVKNAYDADAGSCLVRLSHIDDPARASIVIQDDGVGMTADLLRKVWMVIGTSYRADQKKHQRSTKGASATWRRAWAASRYIEPRAKYRAGYPSGGRPP
ncbi:MAG: ATP-binding protein [Uliginosibacterium sp.]|nr:ATP-binding protein [Uliginosibacterium sp.]